jgi:hypothetical protein
MLVSIIVNDRPLGEISVPTRYFDEASSINFRRSVTYGLGVLAMAVQGALWRKGLYRPRWCGVLRAQDKSR